MANGNASIKRSVESSVIDPFDRSRLDKPKASNVSSPRNPTNERPTQHTTSEQGRVTLVNRIPRTTDSL